MKRFRPYVLVLAAVLVAGTASAQHLRSSVIGAGGNRAVGSAYRLGSTVGQPIAGRASGPAFMAEIGFWYQAGAFGALQPPGAPVLVAPEDGAVDVPTTVALVWNTVPAAAAYDLQVATVADFSTTVIEEEGVAAATFEVSGLAEATRHYWRVRAVNAAGTSGYADAFAFTTVSTLANEGAHLPTTFALHAAYPNPFNPQTTLRYDVPEAGAVRLAVYDALGREVARLVDAERPAGRHEVALEGAGLASGLYLVRLTAEGFADTRTITLLR